MIIHLPSAMTPDEREIASILEREGVQGDTAAFLVRRMMAIAGGLPPIAVGGPLACKAAMESVAAAYQENISHLQGAILSLLLELWNSGVRE